MKSHAPEAPRPGHSQKRAPLIPFVVHVERRTALSAILQELIPPSFQQPAVSPKLFGGFKGFLKSCESLERTVGRSQAVSASLRGSLKFLQATWVARPLFGAPLV